MASSAIVIVLSVPDGTSFTALTLWLSTTLVWLYAVVPPVLLTFTVPPLVTVAELSISVTVSVGALPFQFDAGTNRR